MSTQLADLVFNQLLGLAQNAATQSQFNTLINGIQQLDLTIRQQAGEIEAQQQRQYQDLLQQIYAIRQEQQNIRANTETAQQAGVPVTLPLTPPPAYGGPSSGATAEAVWNYTDFRGLFTPQGINYGLYWLLTAFEDTAGLRSTASDWFLMSGTLINPVNPFDVLVPAAPGTILPTDADIGVWLNREMPGMGWALLTGQQIWQGRFHYPPGTGYIQCTMSAAEFEWFKLANAGLIPGTGLAPVWPGLAKVTLGTPVALALGVTITSPMDGVLIEITSVPPDTGKFAFDATTSWRNVGALAFTSDNGDEEFPQTLGFERAVYSPKTMTRAAGVVVRTSKSVVGTVTPWTIT